MLSLSIENWAFTIMCYVDWKDDKPQATENVFTYSSTIFSFYCSFNATDFAMYKY